jgi:hypothetical protein
MRYLTPIVEYGFDCLLLWSIAYFGGMTLMVWITDVSKLTQ